MKVKGKMTMTYTIMEILVREVGKIANDILACEGTVWTHVVIQEDPWL